MFCLWNFPIVSSETPIIPWLIISLTFCPEPPVRSPLRISISYTSHIISPQPWGSFRKTVFPLIKPCFSEAYSSELDYFSLLHFLWRFNLYTLLFSSSAVLSSVKANFSSRASPILWTVVFQISKYHTTSFLFFIFWNKKIQSKYKVWLCAYIILV